MADNSPYRLHRVAFVMAEKLIKDPKVKALAITGSVARGDAGPASDLDLWVLGDRNAREVFPHPQVDVTLLWQKPRTALLDDSLLRFEVEDAFVLHDPDGLFRKVRSKFWDRREALQEVMVKDTAFVISDLIMNAQRQKLERAIALLREAGRRAAALRIYLDFGWRVPKWRHFEHHLKRGALSRLRALQSFPEEASPWRKILRHMRAHQMHLKPLQERQKPYPPPLPTLERMKWLSKKGHREEAISQLRQSMEDVALGKKPPKAILELWRLAHDFEKRPPRPPELRRAARQCAGLIDALKIENEIDSRWKLADKARAMV